jgi:DnaJ-class molecular chaperone
MNRRRWLALLAVSGFAFIFGRGRAQAQQTCPQCNGSGRVAYYDDIHKRDIVTTCGACGGRGVLSAGGGGAGCA